MYSAESDQTDKYKKNNETFQDNKKSTRCIFQYILNFKINTNKRPLLSYSVIFLTIVCTK